MIRVGSDSVSKTTAIGGLISKPVGVVAAPEYNTIYYDNDTGATPTNGTWIQAANTSRQSAQSFVPNQSGNIGAISLNMLKAGGSTTGNFFVVFEADSSGDPAVSPVGTATIDSTTLTGSLSGMVKYTMDAPMAVTVGVTYWFRAFHTSLTGGDSINITYNSAGSSPGVYKYSEDGGATWPNTPAIDLDYIIWGE